MTRLPQQPGERLTRSRTVAFTFDGKPENSIPPRPMDRLSIEPLAGDPDPMIRVTFERFRSQSEEKIPLA